MAEILKAYKGNRSIRIPAEKKNEYLQNGYTIKDMNGNLVAEPNTDKNRILHLEAKCKALEAENAELKKQQESAGQTPENPAVKGKAAK